MSSSSRPGPRPISPVEEDLQKLYNEVWAVFAEEPPSSERDIENIYSGYTEDTDPTPSSSLANPLLQPTYQHPGRSPSPYSVNKVDTQAVSVASQSSPSAKSPVRRRLPPTPGGSSSSAAPPLPMPVPEPAGSSKPSLYNSTSYASFASSSNGASDLVRRTTAGSGNSAASAPRLPQGSSNGSSHYGEDGQRTPVSPSDYQSHRSFTSSLGSSTTNTTTSTGDGHHRPPGALPPALPPKPSAYQDFSSESQYSYQFNAYDPDNRDVSDDYFYRQPQQPQQSRPNKYAPVVVPPPPPPPPPPLPPVPPPATTEDDFADHSSQATYTSPVASSPYSGFPDFSLKNLSGPPSQNSFFDQEPKSSTSETTPEVSLAGPSEVQFSLSPQEENWDPSISYSYSDHNPYVDNDEPPPNFGRRPTDMLRTLANYSEKPPLDLHESDQLDDYWEDEDEDDEARFVNFSLLSHIAMQLRDKVPRGTHVKGSIPYPRAFTGKDIVSTIQTQIQRELAINHGVSTNDRRVALQVARSLQSQLFFYEVEWGGSVLRDGVEDVYMFLDDQESGSDAIPEREELPTGVITMLTRCYSPSCGEGIPCYSYTCPRKGGYAIGLPLVQAEAPVVVKDEEWTKTIDASILSSLPVSEVTRQTVIHRLITREKQYLLDLDLVESDFIRPLRAADPPVLPSDQVEDFIDEVFSNILDLRECNRRLLEVMYVRQREEGPIILRIGDIFLEAATEFRFAYPAYIGHYPLAEKRLKEETEGNSNFRLFLEHCGRQQSSRSGESPRLDLKHFLNRPAEHLQKYHVLLGAVLEETAKGNPDAEFLREAIEAIKSLQSVAQLRTFQSAMGKGTPGKWEWHDLVPPDVRENFTKQEAKRQSIIFELIKGEMAYVKDLENMQHIYILPLRKAEPPIIPPDRLDQFIEDVFHNYGQVYEFHKKLVDELHEIQREQHPRINSITAAIFDAALNFRDAYMEYIPNYPIAAYRIDDEMANNLAFKTFVDQCVRHPDAHRLDMKNFINRPIPRLLRYELLLRSIMEGTPPGHEDLDSIPNVIDVIKALGKETEPGVFSAKQKVEVWRYNAGLVFKPGESIDMDLLDDKRSLIHSGRLLRQPDSGLEWNGWSELHVLLFDNYLVMTKPKEKDGITKYQVNRRPIPLDLLTLVNFTDPPTQRSTGILRNLRGGERHEPGSANPGLSPESATDSRFVYPLTLHHNGRTGGPYILYAESAQVRSEWQKKLVDALGLRKAIQDSNKVFEVEYLSRDTFIIPSIAQGANGPTWNQDSQFTGKVTCSVPFNTPDGRALVAIGCTEGVWIGFRHDPKSIRRVLHLKMVTQCAMLEDFGIFLVLADKALFAYHVEALVPSSPHGVHTSQVPQKLSGTKDVHFFSVGTLQGRTLIIYMKKKSLNSIFRVLEPIGDKINEGVKAPAGLGSRLGFRSTKSEWFRIYRDFFLPSDSFDVIFLKARIAIFCAKGFEIMNLHDFESITIPQREDPKHAQLARRCESSRPLGMFRSSEDEFLLCYDEFGVYVDKHGDPCRSFGTIEWEGTAERAAFHPPYILLFDSRFIEIRHVETGRLAQIIPGNEIRCTWDGRGVSIQAPAPAIEGSDDPQEAQVHFVMNSTDSVTGPGGMRSRNIVQHVCELIPTVPLPIPGKWPHSEGTISSYLPSGVPQQEQMYNPYAPAPTAPTHMTTHSYGSSTYGSSSTGQGYSNAPTPAQNPYAPGHGSYAPPGRAQPPYGYAPAPVPPNVNPIPGGGAYYGRAGYPTAPPRSPELQPSQSWR